MVSRSDENSDFHFFHAIKGARRIVPVARKIRRLSIGFRYRQRGFTFVWQVRDFLRSFFREEKVWDRRSVLNRAVIFDKYIIGGNLVEWCVSKETIRYS